MADAAKKDWGLDEDDAVNAEAAPTPPPVQKPEVMAHESTPGLVLPKPQVKPAAPTPPQAAKATEEKYNFPSDYGKCLELSATLQGADRLPDRPTNDQIARAAKFRALKKHIFALQQGLPAVDTNAHSKGAFVGVHHVGLSDTKLRLLARTNPDVKKLLAERDALVKENAELKELLEKA